MVIIGLVVLGLCLGSFVNALVYRLHWQEKHHKAGKAEKKRYSIANSRSICPHCKHVLAAKDLIPIYSWLVLKGRCRYCSRPISAQYPLVEAATVALFVISYIFWPYGLSSAENIISFIVWLACLVGFVSLIIYDIKYLILPNKIIFTLILLALVDVIIQAAVTSSVEPISSALWGAIVGGGLFFVLFQVSRGAWIGGGDVKLGFLLGILAGDPWRALLLLFLASFLGTIYSLPMIIAHRVKPKTRIPFGPFLIAAVIIVELFGSTIIDWYTNLAGTAY